MVCKSVSGILSMLVFCSAAYADDKDKAMYALASSGAPQWQQTNPDLLSEDDYLRSVNNNRKIVRKEFQVYANRVIAQDSTYGNAIGLLGAAVAASITDTRVHLNDSKTMDMVFRDTADTDRSVLLQYRITW
jgi:hypothetical protein